MKTDLAGRVDRLDLKASRPLLSVFEAISNSLYAIDQRPGIPGDVEVMVVRKPVLGDGSLSTGEVEGFTISDNGVGFTDENFDSFDTLDSRLKMTQGGKGVGRLEWLKVFDRVVIDSVFIDEGQPYRRKFTFGRGPGVSKAPRQKLVGDTYEVGTTVSLRDMRSPWRENVPDAQEAIGRRVIEHFLVPFVLGTMPRVTVRDSNETTRVDLSLQFKDEFAPEVTREKYWVGPSEFAIGHVLVKRTRDDKHRLLLTANSRAVKEVAISKHIPHLTDSLLDASGRSVTYIGYVQGTLLDNTSNDTRTDFNLPRDGELVSAEDVTFERVVAEARQQASRFLQPLTATQREQAIARATTTITFEAQHLRPMLQHRQEAVAALSAGTNATQFRDELERINLDWKLEVTREASATFAAIAKQPNDLPSYRQKAKQALHDLAQLSISELAEYVLYRRFVIDHMQTLLGPYQNGTLPEEEDLHQVIFPLRTTSDDTPDELHNLWLLDESLVYHAYLASDLPFKQQRQAPISVDSMSRADILAYGPIYDTPLALAEGVPRDVPITIIEFKRPESKPHSKGNPIEQVLDYIDKIRAGKAKDSKGRTIEIDPATVRFYCYIIAHLTPELRTACHKATLTETAGGGGYHGYNPNYRAWIEVKSWQKTMDDATRRHRAFMQRLGADFPAK